jgi:hypothetical protein
MQAIRVMLTAILLGLFGLARPFVNCYRFYGQDSGPLWPLLFATILGRFRQRRVRGVHSRHHVAAENGSTAEQLLGGKH